MANQCFKFLIFICMLGVLGLKAIVVSGGCWQYFCMRCNMFWDSMVSSGCCERCTASLMVGFQEFCEVVNVMIRTIPVSGSVFCDVGVSGSACFFPVLFGFECPPP